MRTERTLALGGPAWAILFLISFSLAGTEPAATAAAEEIQGYFGDWPAASTALYAIAGVGMICYFAALGVRLLGTGEKAVAATALVAAATFAVLQTAGDVAFLSLTSHDASGVDTVQARTMLQLHEMSHLMQPLPMAVFVAAAGWVALSTGVLSRWFAWIGIVLAAYLAVTGTLGVAGAAGFGHDGAASVAGFMAFILWVGVSGVVIARTPRNAPAVNA